MLPRASHGTAVGSKTALCGIKIRCDLLQGSGRRSQAAVVAQERNLVVLGKKTEHLGHRVHCLTQADPEGGYIGICAKRKAHMEVTKNGVVGIATRVAEQLLRENELILLLPAACEDLKDSHYELLLECPLPESVICLIHKGREQVAIGDGFDKLVLLEGNGTSLNFTPTARNQVPLELERILQHQSDNLEGPSLGRCAGDFIEWLYRSRPTRLIEALEYFLANPGGWLIGLPAEVPARQWLSGPAIHASNGFPTHWYPLCQLEFSEQRPVL